MVFSTRNPQGNSVGVGTSLVSWKDTAAQIFPLVFESIAGMIVAISNIFIIVILFAGRKKLFKFNFYIIVANLIVATSLKAFVELAFIVPYYVMQRDGVKRHFGYFCTQYEFVIFNLSVLADYGVLFFSLLIAIDRYSTITKKVDVREKRVPRLNAFVSCSITWVCTALIPFLFFCCECQFVYDAQNKRYFNRCDHASSLAHQAIDCLVYLSYLVALFVFLIYIRIFIEYLYQKKKHRPNSKSPAAPSDSMQFKLLKQSAIIFALYASSILCVLALSVVDSVHGFSEISYAENLLNLSIAAVYPICLLVMSGELRSVLAAKIAPRPTGRIASISVHTPHAVVTELDLFRF